MESLQKNCSTVRPKKQFLLAHPKKIHVHYSPRHRQACPISWKLLFLAAFFAQCTANIISADFSVFTSKFLKHIWIVSLPFFKSCWVGLTRYTLGIKVQIFCEDHRNVKKNLPVLTLLSEIKKNVFERNF